jgi:hypothetical protein
MRYISEKENDDGIRFRAKRNNTNNHTEALTDKKVEELVTILKRFDEGGAKWRDNNYSKTPINRINWNDEPSGCEENSDNWIFL